MSFVEFITSTAERCGWIISDVISESMVAISFDMDTGTETCFIRPCGKSSDGSTILEFSSYGVPVPEDPVRAGQIALILLQRNAEILMGSWGIEIGNQRKFTVFVSQIANTMDDEEFRASVKTIVNEKERFEKIIQKATIDF